MKVLAAQGFLKTIFPFQNVTEDLLRYNAVLEFLNLCTFIEILPTVDIITVLI